MWDARAEGVTRVVAIGGGTGLATLLRGLKSHTSALTAVVTMADDGGSSGRLRDELGVLPPGDVRSCLVALAEDESLMRRVFEYRFDAGGLAGHSLGNLLLTALGELTGSFDGGVREAAHVLAVRGEVLPSTTVDVRLRARLRDGSELAGESVIGRAHGPIESVWLEPEGPDALPQAVDRIREADVVVLGPGSLYTSVIPNLLVRGVPEGLASAEGQVVYVANVMTQPGETAGYDARAHLDGVLDHLPEGAIDAMLVNERPIPDALLRRYRLEGAEPVTWGAGSSYRDVRIVGADLADVEGLRHTHVRHDPDDLAETILSLA